MVLFVMLHILESSTKRGGGGGGEVRRNQLVNKTPVETIEMKAI